MNQKIRTRFAPSPTGDLHIGSLRTALFNWLWARKNQGEFILRLEDTDQNRLVMDADKRLLSDLKDLGLDWDFGPNKPNSEFGSCIQSQRLDIYQTAIKRLLDQDIAYKDYTSPEDLQELRQQAQKNKEPFLFRRNMAQEAPGKNNQSYVIRIAIPDNLDLTWQDVVKGQQSWQGKNIGDFIALKSDGWPTYHFANVIDDYEIRISHVIRADEWLSSTPKHLYLFDCLNWSRPQYVHIPPILSSNSGQKLSKRDQDARAKNLIDKGYLPEAILNYLSLLGWNPKIEQEIYAIDNLIKIFDIKQIQVSPSRFDSIRLDWFNGQHLRLMSFTDLFNQSQKWWSEIGQKADQSYKKQVLELVYQRLKKWSELAELTDFFFQRPKSPSQEILLKKTKLDNQQLEDLTKASVKAFKTSDFSASDLELKLYQLALDQKVSPSKYFTLLRLKMTGRTIAPGLFETMHVLGKNESIARLQK